MNNISFTGTVRDSNKVEGAAKVGDEKCCCRDVVIMTLNRASAVEVKNELLPVIWVQLKAVY